MEAAIHEAIDAGHSDIAEMLRLHHSDATDSLRREVRYLHFSLSKSEIVFSSGVLIIFQLGCTKLA